MPFRNLVLIAVALTVSAACAAKAERNRYSATMAEVMHIVQQEYVEPVESRDLFRHAMDGMITALDPYSGYVDQKEYTHFRESIEQKFGGIGILVELNPDTKRPTIMTPLFSTPAHEAGILSGDVIMEIEGQDTKDLTLKDCVELMRGDPDTPLKLSILHRDAEEPVEMTLIRTIIRTETVLGDKRVEGAEWDYQLQEDPRIAYVRLTSFGDETAAELRQALTDNNGKFNRDYKAIILDLRGNPGGTLYGAIEICNMFIDSGVIVTTRGRDEEVRNVFHAEEQTLVPADIPVTVLVNHYSASASEIVSACLQDHGRATIIGERTWGKGTVQNVIALEGGRSALRLTTATYWRPSNRNIHRKKDAPETEEWGVSPDPGFEVKLTEEELTKVLTQRAQADRYQSSEEKPANKSPREEAPPREASNSEDEPSEKADDEPFDDPQLRKAIEFLQAELQSPQQA